MTRRSLNRKIWKQKGWSCSIAQTPKKEEGEGLNLFQRISQGTYPLLRWESKENIWNSLSTSGSMEWVPVWSKWRPWWARRQLLWWLWTWWLLTNKYGECDGYNYNNGNSYNNWGQNPFQQQQENYYQNPTNNFLQQVTQQQSYSNINNKMVRIITSKMVVVIKTTTTTTITIVTGHQCMWWQWQQHGMANCPMV